MKACLHRTDSMQICTTVSLRKEFVHGLELSDKLDRGFWK